jgi:hypothetical protein
MFGHLSFSSLSAGRSRRSAGPRSDPAVLTIFEVGIIAVLIAAGQGSIGKFLIEVCDFALNETDTPSKIEHSDRYFGCNQDDDAPQQIQLFI